MNRYLVILIATMVVSGASADNQPEELDIKWLYRTHVNESNAGWFTSPAMRG